MKKQVTLDRIHSIHQKPMVQMHHIAAISLMFLSGCASWDWQAGGSYMQQQSAYIYQPAPATVPYVPYVAPQYNTYTPRYTTPPPVNYVAAPAWQYRPYRPGWTYSPSGGYLPPYRPGWR